MASQQYPLEDPLVNDINGVNGVNGDHGINGGHGVNGILADNGVNGVNNINGINGHGVNEVPGINGINGHGVNEVPGINGINGHGVNEVPGINGINGLGVNEVPGINGINGLGANDILVVEGLNGQGVNDVLGVDGINGQGVNGVPGVDGINGDHGVNGIRANNGSVAGGDSLQVQPSTSGGVEPTVPSLRSLCLRGLRLSRELLHRLARRFSGVALGQHALDAVYGALTAAERTTDWASDAAAETHPRTWYIVIPLSIFMMVATTGTVLAEKYLDLSVPSTQQLVDWLNSLRAKVKRLQEEAATLDRQLMVPEPPTTYHPALGPARSPSSTASSLSADEAHLSEEEPPQPETPGDKSLYFSVENLTEEEETEAGVKDNEQETEAKAEETFGEKAQKAEAEDGRPETALVAVAGTAAGTEQARASDAEAAEQVALSVMPLPPSQPASSQDFVAAEGSPRATSATTGRPTKPKKSRFTFHLF